MGDEYNLVKKLLGVGYFRLSAALITELIIIEVLYLYEGDR